MIDGDHSTYRHFLALDRLPAAADRRLGWSARFRCSRNGLGVTGLTDGAPWGMWITLDLSCIGLSAGAFSLSAVTYLLGREQYKPLARVAVFIGLLGYSGAMMCAAAGHRAP